jgi:hypothetical protein
MSADSAVASTSSGHGSGRPRCGYRRLVETLPGDDLIPDAGVVLDRHATFAVSAEELWPWLVQLGKERAGWYLTARLELLVPRRRRALRRLEPRWQELAIGDAVPDWGPGHPTFIVAAIDPPRSLVYRSVRPRKHRPAQPMVLTWALVVQPLGDHRCRLRLRLRTPSLGRRFPRLVTWGADAIDAITVAAMVAGLRERLRR